MSSKWGMMWFDNKKLTLKEKILKGGEYYKRKYGQDPTTCYLSEQDFANIGETSVNGFKIAKDRYIRPNNFFFVVEPLTNER